MCDLGITADSFNPRVLYVLSDRFNHEKTQNYHSHDFIEIKYALSGTCTYHINGNYCTVKKGDMIICNPGVQHQKLAAPEDEIFEFNIGIDNIWIKNLPKNFLISADSYPIINIPLYAQELFKCCTDMLAEQERNEPGSDLVLKSLAMKMVAIFLKGTFMRESTSERSCVSFESTDKTNIVNTIVEFIDANYMNEISLDRIARNMYLSPIYISKVFKEELGESPINHLIKVRLAKAREMLDGGNLSVKAVAKNVGYSDAYYFSKLFKKYYGYPPSKYKV